MEVKAFSRFLSLQDFLLDESINIVRILLDSHDTIACDDSTAYSPTVSVFYVFYKRKCDVLNAEKERLFELVDAAREISTREEYYTLKNVKQRELYLLQEFDLVKKDAEDVMELLKPEMAAIFREL